MNSTSAQIFLADQRGIAESATARRAYTFNFETYEAEGRAAFGPLFLFNDEIVSPLAGLTMTAGQPATVVLLPLVGSLAYQIDGAEAFLEPGQAGGLTVGAGQTYSVQNPYETETINWLQIGLAQSTKGSLAPLTTFDLSGRNNLVPFVSRVGNNPVGYIGLFDGRAEGTYTVEAADGGQRLFVYVVQGVFEVANRLLHNGDALALHYQQPGMLEFEALSNNAMLMLLAL